MNSAGKIWTAAQIEINVSLSPRPPENVQCRPYDNTSICLSWKPPGNVSVQAYSVHSFYKGNCPHVWFLYAGFSKLNKERNWELTWKSGKGLRTKYVDNYFLW